MLAVRYAPVQDCLLQTKIAKNELLYLTQMTLLRVNEEPARSAGSGGKRKSPSDLARDIRRDIQESAATRARCAATLRVNLEQLRLRKGPARLQKRRDAELKLLEKITELLMSSQVERIEKTPGWVELLGQR